MKEEWAYHITISKDNWEDIERWCEANFGPFNEAWYKLGIDPVDFIFYDHITTTWYFKKEKDAVEFALRWA